MDLGVILGCMAEREEITKRVRRQARQEALANKILKCPKCGCADILVHETIEAISEHRVINGVWVHKYDSNDYGGVLSTTCRCKECEHEWTSRRGINFERYFIDEQ